MRARAELVFAKNQWWRTPAWGRTPPPARARLDFLQNQRWCTDCRGRRFCLPPTKKRVAKQREGNPRRGFPSEKQSIGLFFLPSCALAGKGFSRSAERAEGLRPSTPPPFLKGGRKLIFKLSVGK